MTEYTTPHAVTAAKITALQGPRSVSDNYEVTLEGVGPVLLSYRDFVDHHKVAVGGYWLEYADGSIGYLPGETFEALYEVVEAPRAAPVVEAPLGLDHVRTAIEHGVYETAFDAVAPVAEAAPVVVEAPAVAEAPDAQGAEIARDGGG